MGKMSEQLARRVREELGPHNDDNLSVLQLVGRLVKENHELTVDLHRAQLALGMIHTYLRCKPRQVGCALDVIRALERSLTSEHAKSKNQQLTEPG